MMLSALLLAAALQAGPVSRAPVYAHHALSTADPSAQQLFDRGLTLFYAYNGSEGVHVFQALEARDPQLAMAYWGEALSYGPDINVPLTEDRFRKAHDAIEKAAALSAQASDPERTYILAMQRRYAGPWSAHEAAENAYIEAMGAAVARFPSDNDLGTLYAEALLERNGRNLWKKGTSLPLSQDTVTMVTVLDRILARDPLHIMANHLVVHIFEGSTDRSRAVLSANRLHAMPFAPEDEHLAHMPAHTFVDVGQYRMAVTASKRAIALFDTYLALPSIDAFHARYLWHDLRVGYTAAMMLGNYADAQWFAQRLSAKPPYVTRWPDSAAPYAALTAVRFGRWNDAPNISPAGPTDVANLALAYAKIARGDAPGALAALPDALEKNRTFRSLFWSLRGAVAGLQNERAAADAAFTKAVSMEGEDFGGENLPFIPAQEIQGATYYRMGDYAAAARADQAAIDAYPNEARALYGLAQAARKRGQAAQARAALASFQRLWTGSDTPVEALGP